jgi:hypothetical protein
MATRTVCFRAFANGLLRHRRMPIVQDRVPDQSDAAEVCLVSMEDLRERSALHPMRELKWREVIVGAII